MKHGFIKVASACPKVTVGDCQANLSEILKIHRTAKKAGVKLLVYPELSLTGASCGDLFFSDVLLDSAEAALLDFLSATEDSDTISIIGFPLVVNDKIHNCAAICQKGQLLAIIPKENLTSADKRYFSSAADGIAYATIGDRVCDFGRNIIFADSELREFRFAVEIGEDLFSVTPSSEFLVKDGALIIANPSATCETVGAAEFRRSAVLSASSRYTCGYILSSAGQGESTTDQVFGGHGIISENGKLLSQRLPFSNSGLLINEIDVKLLSSERRRNGFDSAPHQNTRIVELLTDIEETCLTRKFDPHPFVPTDAEELNTRCETVLNIVSAGLAQRIVKAYAKKCVIGISGGLDSCLALIVTIRALELLGRPATDVIGVTMPCFGTTERTKSNAERLCEELGCVLRQIDITAAVRQHFSDIGHEEPDRNIVYENSQARERTQILMDIANMECGFVVGTGDLSELALGWATYNGDHMSMYGVNSGIPKTLIREIVRYSARTSEKDGKEALARVLDDIIHTPVSPELLPADEDGNITQKTEDLVGPYEIHDFYIYNTLRYGFAPDKLYRMAKIAFAGVYDDETLLKWLKNFVRRFFAQQFKRSCLPDGPKVGSVNLSPRGDLKMPSDASAAQWLRIVNEL